MSHDSTLDELRKLVARAALVAEAEAATGWDRSLGRMFDESRDEIEQLVVETNNVLHERGCFMVLFVCYFFIHRMLRQLPCDLRPGLPGMTRALAQLAADVAEFIDGEEETG